MKSCLLFIIIVTLAGALVIAMARLAAVEKEREEEKLAAEAKPVEKTPRQLQNERIDEILSDKAPELGQDPAKAMVDGNIMTMKSVREKVIQQQASIKSRLQNTEESYLRLRGEHKQLEQKISKLKHSHPITERLI